MNEETPIEGLALLTVLVVEDEPAHAAAIERAFDSASWPHRLLFTATLRETRQVLQAGGVDIVLADLNLADGQATELLADPNRAFAPPLLVMTSHGDETSAVRALKAGALDYVVKSPVTFAAIPDRVRHAHREWRMMRDQRRAEEALRRSEQRYRLLAENASDIIWVFDVAAVRFSYVSPAVERLLHYTDAEMRQLGIEAILEPESLRYVQQALTSRSEEFQRGVRVSYVDELELRNRDGQGVWVENVAHFLVNAETGRLEVQGVARDISERRRVDRETRLSLELMTLITRAEDLRELLESSLRLLQRWSGCEAMGIRLRQGDDYPYFVMNGFTAEFVAAETTLCVRDDAGIPLRDSTGNPALECMCGNVLLGRTTTGKPFFTPGGSFWSNHTTALLASTSEADRQARTRNRCNGEGYESVALVPLRALGKTFGLIQFNDRRQGMFTAKDLAVMEQQANHLAMSIAHRRTLDELRHSEERWQFALEGAGDGVWDWDLATGAVYFSRRWQEMGGYSPRDCPDCREQWEQLIFPEDQPRVGADMERHLSGQAPIYTSEYRLRGRDGDYHWGLDRGRVIARDEDGKPLRVIGTRSDISARKKAQETLLASLHEKEVLLRELNHRTKNNMQVICAMLSLQEGQTGDAGMRDILRKIGNRIRSMALVHQKLYQSQRLSEINLADYIRELTQLLIQSFAPISLRLHWQEELQEVVVPLDLAVPCGLTLNELISNSLKHAFPGERTGGVTVCLRPGEQGEVELVVADDGIGMPPGFDFKQGSTLGLQLVAGLVERQMRGSIELGPGPGTTWHVRFHLDGTAGQG